MTKEKTIMSKKSYGERLRDDALFQIKESLKDIKAGRIIRVK